MYTPFSILPVSYTHLQLFSDLRTNLSSISVDSLSSAEDHIFVRVSNVVDCSGDDLGSSECIGSAELSCGDQDLSLIHI